LTAREVLNKLRAHGVRVRAVGSEVETDATESTPMALLEQAKGFKTELLELLKNEPSKPESKTINAADLMRREFQEPKFAVQGFIPEGLTLFAGKPKLGKSWLVLGVAIAVASGGRAFGAIPVKQGAVLYLALEDSHRRLQARLEQVLGNDTAPDALEFRTDLPRLDDGGVLEIQDWLEAHPDARLIILDTLARVKPRASKNAQLYDADSDALKPLHRMALERGVAVLIVHHTRKAGADDVFDTISSSTGLTGIVDAMMVLRRPRNDSTATLSVTGRDLEEQEVAMRFDPVTALWQVLGDAKQYETVTPERKAVLDILTKPMTPAEVAKVLNRDPSSTRKLIFGMKGAGLVRRLSDGKYTREALLALPPVTVPTVTPSESSNTQETFKRYPDTVKEQEALLEDAWTNTVTPVTSSKNNAPYSTKGVTSSSVTPGKAVTFGAKLTPELKSRFRAMSLPKQADRMALKGLLEAAENGDTSAFERLYELEATQQPQRVRVKP
jgi:hypothetical protein